MAVKPPSAMLLVQYPLFAANVRVLCDKSLFQSRGSTTLTSTFISIRDVYRLEGLVGVYRGAHLYVLHQVVRDGLRFLTERCFRFAERRVEAGGKPSIRRGEGQGDKAEAAETEVLWYRSRLAVKYTIDAVCYPVLLASTRFVILHNDPRNSWQHVCSWCQKEGALALFSGLFASLVSTALDEVMEWVLALCVDYCTTDSDMELADRFLLKASGSSVASIFTAPVNYVGVIQRCQSRAAGMLEPEPILDLVRSLPWRSTGWQVVLYGGILGLNVKLIQWKMQLQKEEEGAE